MTFNLLNRRDFSLRLISLLSGFGLAGTAFGSALKPSNPALADNKDVSGANEAIQQEILFKANPRRVYSTLAEEAQFDKVVQLSAAAMSLGKAPTAISRESGGTFSLFGGHITGRHIELLPGERIVQAWRVANWDPGIYSIVKFQLNAQAEGTKLVFDHTGFPNGQGQHLAEGWKANYWEPMQKYLAT